MGSERKLAHHHGRTEALPCIESPASHFMTASESVGLLYMPAVCCLLAQSASSRDHQLLRMRKPASATCTSVSIQEGIAQREKLLDSRFHMSICENCKEGPSLQAFKTHSGDIFRTDSPGWRRKRHYGSDRSGCAPRIGRVGLPTLVCGILRVA